jgi:ribosomal protein S18
MSTTLQNKPQSNYKAVKNLLSKGSTNAKTIKNDLETFILYMAPSNLSGFNVCPFASKGCIDGCLNTAGMGIFSNVQLARINKTKFWGYDRSNFYIQLANELLKIHDKAIKKGTKIAIRLNGTSDIDHLDLLKRYSGIDFLENFYDNLLFYDYTKNFNHIKKYIGSTYKITFSRSETNENDAYLTLKNGGNVAVVFANELPQFWNGFPVINGDDTDLRYFDPENVVVGLTAKGKAKKDLTGFVVR